MALKRKVNDDYGIFYNQTHDSQSSKDEDSQLEVQMMSRVDWIIALRNLFHRL